jgi:hypothetical protein
MTRKSCITWPRASRFDEEVSGLSFVVLFSLAWFLLGSRAIAQTVEPVISEYGVKADGKFALTNSTLAPLVVLPGTEKLQHHVRWPGSLPPAGSRHSC